MARWRPVDAAEVQEGPTAFRVAGEADGERGPARAGQGFYNPAMAITRDLTVLAAEAVDPPGRAQFLDGLAAAGARGLRVANETADWQVTLNDRAHETAKLAERNIHALGIEDRAIARCRELNGLLAESSFSMVEVDPYGSPVGFLAGSLRNVREGGIVAFTATDATALHGNDTEPARRRYLAEPPPRHAPGWKEAAARLLVGAIVREAARFDRRAQPLLTHVHEHAFRVYVRVEDGARPANAALEDVDRVALCPDCYDWGLEGCACGEAEPTGPYFLGELQDEAFLEALSEAREGRTLAEPEAVDHLLDRLGQEAGCEPFFLDVDRALKALGLGGPPARDELIAELEAAGVGVSRTHYGPNRLAYEGDLSTVREVLVDLARS